MNEFSNWEFFGASLGFAVFFLLWSWESLRSGRLKVIGRKLEKENGDLFIKNVDLQSQLRMADIDVAETALVNEQLRDELDEYEDGTDIELDISLEEDE